MRRCVTLLLACLLSFLAAAPAAAYFGYGSLVQVVYKNDDVEVGTDLLNVLSFDLAQENVVLSLPGTVTPDQFQTTDEWADLRLGLFCSDGTYSYFVTTQPAAPAVNKLSWGSFVGAADQVMQYYGTLGSLRTVVGFPTAFNSYWSKMDSGTTPGQYAGFNTDFDFGETTLEALDEADGFVDMYLYKYERTGRDVFLVPGATADHVAVLRLLRDGSTVLNPSQGCDGVEDCDDDNPCTDDACAAGQCEWTDNTDPCDDGDACTMDDVCGQGACSGDPLDADGDTYVSAACGGGDCDDADAQVNPGVVEGPAGNATCSDTLDNDCDGDADGADGNCAAVCEDGDGDGYGDPGSTACAHPETDCDDANAQVNPGVVEGPAGNATCSDTLDNDCDGDADGADSNCAAACEDEDGDGYGDPGSTACAHPETDCDDADAQVNPGVVEGPAGNATCSDTLDNDCDGGADGADGNCAVVCEDGDGDGYGDPGSTACAHPETDCDDADAQVNPGADEGPYGDATCSDTLDNDCDGNTDGVDSLCAPLLAPTLHNPVSGGTVTSTSPVLSVSNSGSDIGVPNSYEFELYADYELVGGDPVPADLVQAYVAAEGSVLTSWNLADSTTVLDNGKHYYWRCRTVAGEATSGWMPLAVFLVNTSGQATTVSVQASGLVSADSGEVQRVEVDDEESDLYGVAVRIPAGALPEDARVSIGLVANAPALPQDVQGIGEVIDFGPSGFEFEQSVDVLLPYTQEDLDQAGVTDPFDLEVYTYDPLAGNWEEIAVHSIENDLNLLVLEVEHFSLFQLGKQIAQAPTAETAYEEDCGSCCFIATAAREPSPADDREETARAGSLAAFFVFCGFLVALALRSRGQQDPAASRP